MAHASGSIGLDLEQLSERLHELEQRVYALEHKAEQQLSSPPDVALEPQPSPAVRRGFLPTDLSVGAGPILGKAVLGIAGAYLLRAIAESGWVPKLPVLAVAVAYAGLWMVWAVRAHAANRFACAAYAITSAAILSPLLWESTVRFQVLSPSFAAVVLVAFLVLSLALARSHDLQLIPWVATLAGISIAIALIIATHELVALTTALLAAALVTELACLERRLTVRAIPALAADFALWLLIDVMTSHAGVPEDYHPASHATILALSIALLAIYGASIGIRTFAWRQRITIFEIVQLVLILVLSSLGVMRATHGAAVSAEGALFLILSGLCYWGALRRFADEPYPRNRRVSAHAAAVLLLAGTFLTFPATLQSPFLCLVAVAAAFVYTRTRKLTLGMHASFCLAAAAAVSSLPHYAESALGGTVPQAPDWSLLLVVGSAALCYVIGSWISEEQKARRMLWIVPAFLVALAAAVLAVVAIVRLSRAWVDLDAPRLAVIRTAVNCLLAVGLGYLGSRWKHIELGYLAYGAVAFGTLKLLFEDLRFGNPASLVVSLLFYGLILILLPRMTRSGTSSATT